MKTNKSIGKSILLVFIISLVTCTNGYSNQKTINVNINNNIETAAILYVISDIGLNILEGSLNHEARQHFDPFKDHEVLKMFKELLNKDGLWAPVDLFLIIKDFPNAEISETSFKALVGDKKVKSKYNFINQFIKSVNDFYVEANVEKFIQDHKIYYEKCINNVRKNLPGDNFIPTMEKYYGNNFDSYNIIPSPILYPFIGIGFQIKIHDKIDIYYVAGPFEEPDSTQKYAYGYNSPEDIRDMSVHEFGHSFINPLFELRVNRKLINKYSYLFEPIEKYMSEQAYRDWLTCVNEHIVRLGEIRIAMALNNSTRANKIRKENIEDRKFIYLPYLEEKILEYENNRKSYKTFAEFLPELIKVFSEIDTTKIKI